MRNWFVQGCHKLCALCGLKEIYLDIILDVYNFTFPFNLGCQPECSLNPLDLSVKKLIESICKGEAHLGI